MMVTFKRNRVILRSENSQKIIVCLQREPFWRSLTFFFLLYTTYILIATYFLFIHLFFSNSIFVCRRGKGDEHELIAHYASHLADTSSLDYLGLATGLLVH